MTDASDSDASCDDDGMYNTSASELWDSFWPDSTESSSIYQQFQEYNFPLLQPEQRGDYLNVNPTRRQLSDADDDTIKIATREHYPQEEELVSPHDTIQPPPLQSTPKKSPVTYSVYPKPPVISMQRHPHPPRTSSLSFEPPSPPRRPSFLRCSRSSAGLKCGKSTHNVDSHFIAPSIISCSSVASLQQRSSTAGHTAASVPVSPAYPPPPTPKTLRPITSAFNLRDKARVHSNSRGPVSHNVTAPLAPLLPSPMPELLPTRPQVERFVSVFDLDSDTESETEAAGQSRSFAKRIARGLQKRSTIERRALAERKAVTSGLTALDAGSLDKDSEGNPRDSLSRKRGGSLGRIFGFIGM
ncbi:hypothetical protein E0Z10_g3100 [Xylaria hypoxylon]|uniref:Uncharacterized protein n=1 Tax=Xylaria hypoxylon TaxID=37992 RepID=A0A4Z0Z1Q6_9PEZI|nr:hypothetical protein E0Z10_g3100 [Xylaria hypoxylon]